MLKNPTTSAIVLIVVAVVIVCIYLVNSKPVAEVTPTADVVQVVPSVTPVENTVETVVTPLSETTVTPAPTN